MIDNIAGQRGCGRSIRKDEFFGSLDACGMVACGGWWFIHWQCRRSRYRSRMRSEIGSSGGDEAMRSARGCPGKLSLYEMRMRLRGLSGGACRQYMRISRMSSKAGMLRLGGCLSAPPQRGLWHIGERVQEAVRVCRTTKDRTAIP